MSLTSDYKPNTIDVGYEPCYPPQVLMFPDTYPRLWFSQVNLFYLPELLK